MRKNTREVWQAWQQGKARKACEAVWTDGTDIYSYGTCVVTCSDDGTPILNRTRYSVTTSGHQTSLAVLLGQWCTVVTGVPMHATRERLKQAARPV